MEIILFTQCGANRRRLHLGSRGSACVLGAAGGLVVLVATAVVVDTPAARTAGNMVRSASHWMSEAAARHVGERWNHFVAVISGEGEDHGAGDGATAGAGGNRESRPLASLESEDERIDRVIRSTEQGIDALALRLGTLQAHISRLDALGSRLVEMAKLDAGEFAFGEQPARGGPRPGEKTRSLSANEFVEALDALERRLDRRMPQLDALETMLMNRKLQAEIVPAGQPVKAGWLSSPFGSRADPLTGKRDFHYGIDFAGRRGTPIHAVASGVVTFSGRRAGYGNMVEVNHGNGTVTRYAHNHENLVAEGDTVKKGMRIALLGSTGRVSGPHVHFEVLRAGKQINPFEFVKAGDPSG
ncbi:MAG: M23 family metallopeptidase [Gammaproteobacteria bacterium]